MIYLLDTNILIYLIKNQPRTVAQRIDALSEDDSLCMSFVTWAGLLKGAERSTRKPTCFIDWTRWHGRCQCAVHRAQASAATTVNRPLD